MTSMVFRGEATKPNSSLLTRASMFGSFSVNKPATSGPMATVDVATDVDDAVELASAKAMLEAAVDVAVEVAAGVAEATDDVAVDVAGRGAGARTRPAAGVFDALIATGARSVGAIGATTAAAGVAGMPKYWTTKIV